VHGHHVDDKIDLLPSRDYVRCFKVDENVAFSYCSALGHALRTAPLQWIVPVSIMARESLRGAHFRRKFYRFYLLELLFVYGLVLGLFLVHPGKAFCYFAIMYGVVYVMSRHVDYVTHVSGRADASRYGFANVCLHPTYNKLLWNFGFHVAHHLQPRAHWSALPSIYRDIDVEGEGAPVARTVNYFGAFSPMAFSWHRVKEAGGSR
jgi:fatty acid desaturase